MSIAGPDITVSVSPDGTGSLQLGSETIDLGRLPERMSKQQREQRVDQGFGFGRGRMDDDSLALGKAPIQRLCDAGQLFDLLSEVFAKRLLKRAAFAVLILTASHGLKRIRKSEEAA